MEQFFFARRHSSFWATFLIVTTGKGTGVRRVFYWPLGGIGQFTSVTESCPTLCSPMDYSTSFPVHHQLLEFVHTHVYRVGDAIQPSYPLFSSVTQSCPTLCNPMDCGMSSFPVHHQLLELIQTYVHQVSDAIQPSHPLSSPSPPAFNLSQHQALSQ